MHKQIVSATRRLSTKERTIFDRVSTTFEHLRAEDSEQVTQYAEAEARYADALKQTKRNPTVEIPLLNKSTGNQIGTKTVPNPLLAVLRQSQAAMDKLARRLLIDAASASKRAAVLRKQSESATESTPAHPRAGTPEAGALATADNIKACVKWLRKVTQLRGPVALKRAAIWFLTYPVTCLDDASFFMCSFPYRDDDGSEHVGPTCEQLLQFHQTL